MKDFSRTSVPNPILLSNAMAHLGQEHAAVAELLADLGEIDDRQLYLPAAHSSMFSFCVHHFGMTEDEAYTRIRAARTARRFPTLFPLVAAGRLHVSAILMLTPHLTPENAAELIEAAAGKGKREIEEWLAQRFPGTEMLPMVVALPAAAAATQLAPERVGTTDSQLAPERVDARPTVEPVAAGRFVAQFMMDQRMYDDLRRAQALLGVPTGDLTQLIGRALQSLVRELEKRKFAATDRPRQPRPASSNPRCIPAHVKRAVRERDRDQCTFESDTGHRCTARTRLEFDHIEPVARGGTSSVENLRLRCHAHNQFEAERAFGAGFMHEKREKARAAAARKRAAEEVIPYLRHLGMRAGDARDAAAQCASIPDAPLEERLRAALQCYGSRRLRMQPGASTGNSIAGAAHPSA